MATSSPDVFGALEKIGGSAQGSYAFRDVKELIKAIIGDLQANKGNESTSLYRQHPRRIIAALKRVLLTYGDKAQEIVLNPLFQDPDITEILQETQNFGAGDNKEDKKFLDDFITDEDVRRLFSIPLPVDFSKLKDLKGEEREFVKQRVLRGIGEDTSDDIRRAFLLQTIYYTGYGYNRVPSGSNSTSKFGCHLHSFAQVFGKKQTHLNNCLNCAVIGNPFIMDCIDAIIYYNNNGSLVDLQKQQQTLYKSEKLQNIPEFADKELQELEKVGSMIRAERFSRLFFRELKTTFSQMGEQDIEGIYRRIIDYTGDDRDKICKVLLYIQNYLGIPNSKGINELNYILLARKTGISRQQYDNVFGSKKQSGAQLLLLRCLITVVDTNKGKAKFSKAIYKQMQGKFAKKRGRPRLEKVKKEKSPKGPNVPRFEGIEAIHITEREILNLRTGISEEFIQGVWNNCKDNFIEYKKVFEIVAITLGCTKGNGKPHFQKLAETVGFNKAAFSKVFQSKKTNYPFLENFFNRVSVYLQNSNIQN